MPMKPMKEWNKKKNCNKLNECLLQFFYDYLYDKVFDTFYFDLFLVRSYFRWFSCTIKSANFLTKYTSLSDIVRASQLGYKSCEVPVTRKYPNAGKVPTKISFLGGNTNLLKILFANLFGRYNPDEVKKWVL